MVEHPLLIFPQAGRADRDRRRGGGRAPQLPDPGAQAARLSPQFQRLQQAMDRQRLALQDNPLGIQPEQVLVLETVGSVDRFINAVRTIKGLEWLGEFEVRDIAPGYGFQVHDHPDRELTGQLFLVMTDQEALRELRSLFRRWRRNPGERFPRGLAPLRQAFIHLREIRPWDAQDRVRDTGLFEDWDARGQYGEEAVPFEAELWFRGDAERRRRSGAWLTAILEALGGEVIQQCVIPDIAYHAVLGRIPRGKAVEVIAQREVKLLQCEDVMYLRPVGQCAIGLRVEPDQVGAFSAKEELPTPRGDPVVALLDGLPLTGHRLLRGRLVVDDPDDYESAYQARERVHGTAMASLLCHGDLGDGGTPTTRPVYVRPIMQPRRGFGDQSAEGVPDGVLPVDLVHRAVRRLFEGEGGEPPAAPHVRVVNLSVCDRARPLDRAMSPWARLLDWLSWKYNVLFVVSAGNHERDIELDIPTPEFRDLGGQQRQDAIIRAVAHDTRHRRLLSPAETLNGVTIAAAHTDASAVPAPPNLVDPLSRAELPSTLSAHGPGYRRAIKPDFLLPGGRQLLAERLGTTHSNAILQTRHYNRPPGQRVAAPGAPGELNGTLYTRGTSNSAALGSRWAALLLDVIEQLRAENGPARLPAKYDMVLLKALLVHGADWGSAGELYQSILQAACDGRELREYVGRFLGYGSASVSKVMACTDQRVTVLGVGELEDGNGHEFLLPLPPSLSAVTERRRLAITLAWVSPVNCTRRNYRTGHLWFDPKNRLAGHRACADHDAVQRGTVQHEVLDGTEAVDFQDGEVIAIKVNCRADAGGIVAPIRYGLAVTLGVAEGVGIPVYQEVRDRLRVRLREAAT